MANPVMECIMERRSYRKFKSKQIKEEELKLILDAGLYAPNAGSGQRVKFLVSQDREVNAKLGIIDPSVRPGKQPEGFYVSKQQPSIIDDPTIKNRFYDAPTIVTLLGKKNFLFREIDCAVAAENMMLAAWSLGIGSCIIGMAERTFETDYGKEVLADVGMDDSFIPICHVILGYPDGDKPVAKPRLDNRIYRI